MKVNKKLLFLVPSAIASIALVPTIGVIGARRISSRNSNILGDVSNITQDVTDSTTQDVKELVRSTSNFINKKVVTNFGPIVFWEDTITSLDWFGAKRWSIDLKNDPEVAKLKNSDGSRGFPDGTKGYGTDIKRSWLNYDYDFQNNVLWILSNVNNGWGSSTSRHPQKNQWFLGIDGITGKIKYSKGQSIRIHGRSDVYNFLSILDDGDPVAYGLGFSINSLSETTVMMERFDKESGNVELKAGNWPKSWVGTDSGLGDVGRKHPQTDYTRVNATESLFSDIFYNIIPIGNNLNIGFTIRKTNPRRDANQFVNDVPWQKSSADVSNVTLEIKMLLLDDQLTYALPNDSTWGAPVHLFTPSEENWKNKFTYPSRDYYKLLDGRIVTLVYNNIVIITPGVGNSAPSYTIKAIENGDKWIESWTFDNNEDLFYKVYGETEIKKLTLDPNKTSTNHLGSLYYDLVNSPIDDIKNNARNFSLYNVYGYAGQIMLINSYFDGYNARQQNITLQPDNKYGLAAAIVSNKNASGQGDTKGLLNGENAYLKSADFNISQDVLNKKLPSEITREDITFLNESFLTKNTAKNEDGSLKYEPFVKNEIDDINKTLQITLNLDQIPWFVSDGVMPSNIVPLKITKSFSLNTELTSRFSWKNVDQEDYDFRNTLPSKMTIEDIQRVSPLVSTLTSQRQIINGDSYPKTEYQITKANDTTGKIKIQATYKYLPMELSANTNNIKQYITEKEYTIFKSTDSKGITFVGNNNSDVSQIPELKEIKESNILPSSFLNASKQEYLKFIDINNSAGYPLSKMNITASADDVNGTLTINIDPTAYDSSLSVQTKTYTGLNKTNTYSLRFKDESTIKPNYLPSEINEELFYQNFLTFSGFDSSDFELQLYPNDVTGALTANIILVGNYPNGPTANSDFKLENGQWIARRTFTGFKNIDDYNKEYQLSFKEDGHISLYEVQRLTPSEIKTKLESNNGLTIGNKTYTDGKDFIQLFISSKGSKLPAISNNSNVDVNMYINNGGGEITWSITFNNLEGYANPITFLHTIGGFAKGNNVATSDILTFKNSNQLKLSHSSYFNMLPSKIKAMLENDKQLINNFFLNTPTGGYYTAIQDGNFTLEIVANDTRGTLNIKIKFEKNNTNNIDSNSLLEYNQTFTGFMYH